jgi:hypothetical protein
MFHSPFCETHEVNVEPAKVPAIDIAGKMPLAGWQHPSGALRVRGIRYTDSRWNIRGWATWRSQGHVSLQPVRHAWKVNECITAVNFYTASIQEDNQYPPPFDGRLRWITQFPVLMLLAWLALPAGPPAQFGHPLDGQWSGQWRPKDNPTRLLLNLDCDGRNITG